MTTSTNGQLVAEKLHRFRARLKPLTKNAIAVMDGGEYRYAPIDDILAHIGKPLARYGCYIVQTVTGDIGVTTRIYHISGEWIEDTVIVAAKSMDDKGAAITRLRRYALITLLGLPTVDAPQAQSESEKLIAPLTEAERVVLLRKYFAAARNLDSIDSRRHGTVMGIS